MICDSLANDCSEDSNPSADERAIWIDTGGCDPIATARATVLQLEAGDAIEAAPTTLFRLALELRHSGNMEGATVLFRHSGRMLTEQYLSERLHLRRRGA